MFLCEHEDIPSHLLEQGQSCADALALNQFATWSPSGITIWQGESLEKRFEIIPHSDLDGLTELLDQFKVLAVIEAKNNSELTSWHLSNLCLQSINQGGPSLSAYLRRKNLSDSESAARQAQTKLMLCVARMLSALHADAIPPQTKPENLDATLAEIARAQFQSFALESEAELDKKSSILLHNLLRRLNQIRIFQENPQRAYAMLEQIITSTIPKGCSLQEPSFALPEAQNSIYTPDITPGSLHLEVDTGARLLLKNLARKMRNIDISAISQYEQIFSIPATMPTSHTNACFYLQTKPDAAGVESLNTHMRLSWPGRRINLTKSVPLGLWQLTYMLGIIEEGSTLYARLPPDLFQSRGSGKILSLIHECTTLISAAHAPEAQSVELFIHKAEPQGQQTTFMRNRTTQIDWHQHSNPVEIFLSALDLETRLDSADSPTRDYRKNKQQNLRQQLTHELDSRGLPDFPAGYIYHISEEDLEEFHFEHPPWHIYQSFMGSCALRDDRGNATCEAGEIKAMALILASYLHKAVNIPKSEKQCKAILSQYLEDLKRVHLHILEESHVHIKTSAAAKRFGNKFWKELPFPPWSVCKDVAAQLGIPL